MKKQLYLVITFAFISMELFGAVNSEWVRSYGSTTPYNPAEYITGFASVARSEADSEESAKDRALADLSKKIKVHIQSELVMREEDHDGQFRSAITSLTKSSVDSSVRGADFLIESDHRNIYALAYISRDKLQKQYIREASDLCMDIQSNLKEADSLLGKNRSQDALRLVYENSMLFTELYENYALYRSVASAPRDKEFFASIAGVENIDTLKSLERENDQTRNRVSGGRAASWKRGWRKWRLCWPCRMSPSGD